MRDLAASLTAALGVAIAIGACSSEGAPRPSRSDTPAVTSPAGTGSSSSAGSTSPKEPRRDPHPKLGDEAPAGAFTTAPVERAALARLLEDASAKQTPEMLELALQGMVQCPMEIGVTPPCQAWKDYQATVGRPVDKARLADVAEVSFKYLKHRTPWVRLLAGQTLMRHAMGSEPIRRRLVEALKVEPDPVVLADILQATLGTGTDPETIAFKRALLTHASPYVRMKAASSLFVVADKDEQVADDLVAALEREESADARASLCSALKRSANPRATALRERLAAEDSEPGVRRSCAASAGAR